MSSDRASGLLLVYGGSLLIEELFAIEEACGFDVNNLPTEEGLLYRARQVFAEDMGIDFDACFVTAKLQGQEWQLFFMGLDPHLTKYARLLCVFLVA